MSKAKLINLVMPKDPDLQELNKQNRTGETDIIIITIIIVIIIIIIIREEKRKKGRQRNFRKQ